MRRHKVIHWVDMENLNKGADGGKTRCDYEIKEATVLTTQYINVTCRYCMKKDEKDKK
jgi:hypothetical protein